MSKKPFDRVLQYLGKSQFFTYSALFHLLLVAFVGSQVLIEKQKNDPPGSDPEVKWENPPIQVVEPVDPTLPDPGVQPKPVGVKPTDFPVKWPTPVVRPDGPLPPYVHPVPPTIGPRGPIGPIDGPAIATPRGPTLPKLSDAEKAAIKDFTAPWRKSGTKTEVSGNSRFKFKAYVAKYADGNWDSTHRLADGKIVGGALPNLAYVMRSWTKDRIDAEAVAQPLDLASQEIFNEKPPFIFFTGTRDFVLTEAEVTNLRRYLLVGGAIWGDSSLPGRNSRFDLAFRREMKRVVSDKNSEFAPLPESHPLFSMKFPLKEVPSGLNFYQESVYGLNVYGELAILYTANDYGDMMRTGLTADGKIDNRRAVDNSFVAIDRGIWDHRATYYRNISESSLVNTYEFSTNVVYYLLTRWETRLRGM